MARNVHSSLQPSPVQSARVTSTVRRYEILTPMVGGGIKSFETDLQFPIRPTALRGMLRYWWRATRGWQSQGDIHRLRALEASIWGGSYKDDTGKVNIVASPVSIDVVILQQGQDIRREDAGSKITNNPDDKAKIYKPESRFSYVLFPLRDATADVVGKLFLKFELRIRFTPVPHVNIQDEIDAALWAWELFGGVGARTRRGCGSIQSLDNTKRIDEVLSDGIQRFLSGAQGGAWPAHVPSLQGLNTTQEYQPHRASVSWRRMQDQNSVNAWINIVEVFKLQLRQARNSAGTKNNIGSSKWFEANVIRKIFSNQRQTPPFQTDKSPSANQMVIARLQLGAPMEMSFINPKHFRPNDSNQYKFTVSVDENNELRVPSPLIFRVWRAPNGSIYQVVLIMGGLRTPDEAIVKSAQLPYPERVKTRGTGTVQLHQNRRAALDDVLRVAFEILKGN
jgi:CRISPR-associated protein Cmr1